MPCGYWHLLRTVNRDKVIYLNVYSIQRAAASRKSDPRDITLLELEIRRDYPHPSVSDGNIDCHVVFDPLFPIIMGHHNERSDKFMTMMIGQMPKKIGHEILHTAVW